MTTPPKVIISALVVVGLKEIITTGKMYDETISVHAVIKFAMDKAAEQAERDFKDKDEWKAALKVLQEAGKLTYDAVSDNISLPV